MNGILGAPSGLGAPSWVLDVHQLLCIPEEHCEVYGPGSQMRKPEFRMVKPVAQSYPARK